MKKLEERKAEALNALDNYLYKTMPDNKRFTTLSKHIDIIRELLQPAPTDDEVIVFVETFLKSQDPHFEFDMDAFKTLIRRATQPKSCDKLVEALENVEKACLCTRQTYGFDYSDNHEYIGKAGGGKRWNTPDVIAKQALAKHRKGDV